MKVIKDNILISELKEMAQHMHGSFVKAIVDVEKKIIAVDAPLHADLFELLMEKENSEPKDLWGINLYPEKSGDDFVEFDSMMNIKPGLGNKTRYVEDNLLREKILEIVKAKVT